MMKMQRIESEYDGHFTAIRTNRVYQREKKRYRKPSASAAAAATAVCFSYLSVCVASAYKDNPRIVFCFSSKRKRERCRLILKKEYVYIYIFKPTRIIFLTCIPILTCVLIPTEFLLKKRKKKVGWAERRSRWFLEINSSLPTALPIFRRLSCQSFFFILYILFDSFTLSFWFNGYRKNVFNTVFTLLQQTPVYKKTRNRCWSVPVFRYGGPAAAAAHPQKNISIRIGLL